MLGAFRDDPAAWPILMDEKTEAQRGKVICPKAQNLRQGNGGGAFWELLKGEGERQTDSAPTGETWSESYLANPLPASSGFVLAMHALSLPGPS